MKTKVSIEPEAKAVAPQPLSLVRLEYIRNSFILHPLPDEPAETILVAPTESRMRLRIFCSCQRGSYAKCEHGIRLRALYDDWKKEHAAQPLEKALSMQLLAPAIRANPYPAAACRVEEPDDGGSAAGAARVFDRQGVIVAEYVSRGADRHRFACRLRSAVESSRYAMVERAREFVLSDYEKTMLSLGNPTQRISTENSLWYRIAYHWLREHGADGSVIDTAVSSEDGGVSLLLGSGSAQLRVVIPRDAAIETLRVAARYSNKPARFAPAEPEMLFTFEFDDTNDTVTVIPVINSSLEPEAPRLREVEPRFTFGTWVYIPAEEAFFHLYAASHALMARRWGRRRTIARAELAGFIQTNIGALSLAKAPDADQAPSLFDSNDGDGLERIVGLPFIKKFDSVEIGLEALERDWCWISATYGAGEITVSLEELLTAREAGRRFIVTRGGVVDLSSDAITPIWDVAERTAGKRGLRIPRAALLQLTQEESAVVSFRAGRKGLKKKLNETLLLQPCQVLPPLAGLKSTLREYQKNGVGWLLYLYDNSFGGLLCDDMGLGKTHQVLGLFVAVREHRGSTRPFLVVCPTTVISHWQRLLERFAPGLSVYVHHGSERLQIMEEAQGRDVVITSYGILRNDVELLNLLNFDIAVFDEAQYLKNRATLSAEAAGGVKARIKIGCTGTPVENSVADFKSLFDLILPGYLGGDAEFSRRFMQAEGHDQNALNLLRRMTAPFILRRLKAAVLTELPPKIEDIRTCALSDEQTGLYRQIIATRGVELIRSLRSCNEPIPYLHIFAVLTLLKQLCDHPALSLDQPLDYREHASGKWDLFTELLGESLDSGQKVVVFTQYLGMIAIIAEHCRVNAIGHAVLQGSTRDRAGVVERFNRDADCRVFIGSLGAGGVGIDLVAASVVIHYDRWWTAAREDQATDRVHRIGQSRGVQVFKLVTEGTLEEKIHALIEKKRLIAQAALAEDSPDSLKGYSRDELLTLLDV
jgi:hypothetical protein